MVDRYRKLEADRYDAIVVGAGTGGLVAAALLARHGRRVLVIDQHYVAGGNTTVFRRRGYEFDVGLHYIGDCGANGLVPRILRAAGAEPVVWEELDPDGFDTMLFPDLTFRYPRGLANLATRLHEAFPAERRGLERYLRLLRATHGLTQLARHASGAVDVARGADLLLRWAMRPFAEFLDTCTRDPRLRAVLTAHHGIYALPPSRTPTLLAVGVTAHYADGAYFPRGGGQVTSDRLVASIERHGGTVLLRAQVERIVVEKGHVTGVELRSKHLGHRRVRAPVVISNADLKQTLTRLVDAEHLTARTRSRTAEYEMSLGLGVVYLGLDRDLAAEGMARTNFFVNDTYDLEAAYAAWRRGEFRNDAGVYVTVASLKDPTNRRLAPPGHTNLQIMTTAPSSPEAWGVDPRDLDEHRYGERRVYQQRKRRFARDLVAQAERAIPGLARSIVFEEVATPLTHRRYTLATGGTSYGIALTPEQFGARRPAARTEIEGLYLCGASLRTAHGIPGAASSGVVAAAEVLGPWLYAEVFGPWNSLPRSPLAEWIAARVGDVEHRLPIALPWAAARP